MSKRMPVSKLLIILGSLLFGSTAWSTEPLLKFQLAGEVVTEASLVKLRREIKTHNVAFFHPFLNKEKRYQAFSIKDLLDFAYRAKWTADEYSDLAFIALDGYEAVSTLDKLREQGGFLAFKDLDRENGWEPVGYKQANPGPFFLIWTGREQTTANAYPWPWQVAELNLLRFEDQYPAVVPKGAGKHSGAYRGFEIFRARCLRCHSIDQEGGKIGPDLNAPQSITAYRSKRMIKEMIRNPSRYRYSQMPDHRDLSDSDLENLYLYFQFQAARK